MFVQTTHSCRLDPSNQDETIRTLQQRNRELEVQVKQLQKENADLLGKLQQKSVQHLLNQIRGQNEEPKKDFVNQSSELVRKLQDENAELSRQLTASQESAALLQQHMQHLLDQYTMTAELLQQNQDKLHAVTQGEKTALHNNKMLMSHLHKIEQERKALELQKQQCENQLESYKQSKVVAERRLDELQKHVAKLRHEIVEVPDDDIENITPTATAMHKLPEP